MPGKILITFFEPDPSKLAVSAIRGDGERTFLQVCGSQIEADSIAFRLSEKLDWPVERHLKSSENPEANNR